MTDLSDTGRRKIAELRADYAGRLRNKVESIRALSHGDPAEMAREVHQLVGSAGTFGFLSVGEAAHALELYLEGGQVAGDRIAELLADLGAAVESALEDPGGLES